MNRHFRYLLEDPSRDFFQKVAEEQVELPPRLMTKVASRPAPMTKEAQIDEAIGILKMAGPVGIDLGMCKRAAAYIDHAAHDASLSDDEFFDLYEKVAGAAIDTDFEEAMREAGDAMRTELSKIALRFVQDVSLEKIAGAVAKGVGLLAGEAPAALGKLLAGGVPRGAKVLFEAGAPAASGLVRAGNATKGVLRAAGGGIRATPALVGKAVGGAAGAGIEAGRAVGRGAVSGIKAVPGAFRQVRAAVPGFFRTRIPVTVAEARLAFNNPAVIRAQAARARELSAAAREAGNGRMAATHADHARSLDAMAEKTTNKGLRLLDKIETGAGGSIAFKPGMRASAADALGQERAARIAAEAKAGQGAAAKASHVPAAGDKGVSKKSVPGAPVGSPPPAKGTPAAVAGQKAAEELGLGGVFQKWLNGGKLLPEEAAKMRKAGLMAGGLVVGSRAIGGRDVISGEK